MFYVHYFHWKVENFKSQTGCPKGQPVVVPENVNPRCGSRVKALHNLVFK